MKKTVAIGIDLGTAESCVAVWQNGKLEVVPNDQGNKSTANYVAFRDEERLIGDQARNQAAINPTNTIYNVKRLIGRKYEEVDQADVEKWPFKVINVDEKPKVEVMFEKSVKMFTPEEMTSMMLGKIKRDSEEFLGCTVRDVVVTVPAYFNDYQRQATKDAAIVAGLNVLRVINEPTAAALAYTCDKNLKGAKKVLVYDLGGGKLDVSVVSIEEGTLVEVKGTAGDPHLGGEDFDDRLLHYFMEEFKRKFNQDITGNSKAKSRLKTAVERVKKTLSTSSEATLEVDALYEGIDFYSRVSRARFEELNSDLFRKSIRPIEKALSYAQLEKDDIHEVILVGGATKIPKIQSLIENYFHRDSLDISMSPNEGVAFGAAIQAALLIGDLTLSTVDLLLFDITPFTVGIKTDDTEVIEVIKMGTRIPNKREHVLTTWENHQSELLIEVYQIKTENTTLLGTYELLEIPPARKGVPKLEITFDLDIDNILHVTAKDITTANSRNIPMKIVNLKLGQEEIERMILEASKMKENDDRQKEKIAVRNQLDGYMFSIRQALENMNEKMSEKDKKVVEEKCDEIDKWLDENVFSSKEEYQNQLEECQHFMSSYKEKLEI